MDSYGIAHECRPAKWLVSALMALLSVTMSGSILGSTVGVTLGVNNMGKTMGFGYLPIPFVEIY